jgi:two-component system response regulator HydG
VNTVRAATSAGALALVVDDDIEASEALARSLVDLDVRARKVTTAAEALALVDEERFDVVITDVRMPGMDGLQLCARLAQVRPELPVVVLTGLGNLATAVAALRARAYDFLTKPLDLELLAAAVDRAVQHKRLSEEVYRLRAEVDATANLSGLVGGSSTMRRVHETIAHVAPSDATVLVCGETGTGKELVARQIHDLSPRRCGPFVSVNCAAIPSPLLESEFFGHARGAFTDAKTARVGLFVEAHRGTLFLDEIGEMPLEMQVKLLRVLQGRTVRPVGSSTDVAFDTRIVAATNRDLEEEVSHKRFREDLFYRINVVRIDLPPLRERGSDVLVLAQRFLAAGAARAGQPALGLSTDAAEKLLAYHWPGNVRELENCMERAMAFAKNRPIGAGDLPPNIVAYRPDRFTVEANDAAEIVTLGQLERRYVMRVLALLGNNKARAAARLGIDRRTLYRKLEHWEQLRSRPDRQPIEGEAVHGRC